MDNCIMAEKCNKNSNATSSSTTKWWPDVHASSICSWNASGVNYASNPPCNNSQKPNSNCSNGGEEDVSVSTSFITNASNNSGLSMESSRQRVEKASNNDPYAEAVSDNHHIWNQVLLDHVGTTGELQNIPNRMLEPACDYLKKIESGWDLSSPTNINQFQKNFNGFKDGFYQSKIPSTVNSWSIGPQEDEISPQFDQYIGQFTTIKNEQPDNNNDNNHNYNIHCDALFRKRLSGHAIDYEAGIHQMVVGDNHKNYYSSGMSDVGRGFVDLIGFGSCINKPSSEINMFNKSMMNAMNQHDGSRKPDLHNSYQPVRPKSGTIAKISGRGNGVVNEGKRKKSENQFGSLLKKTKLETSTVSPTKVQIPKAKLGDKITALQQIVSPFGKTDTASVLFEAISYIKCLQEQIQLLSNPYMKTNIIKDSWMRFETKDRGDMKFDLKSKGLCLVPVSFTPEVYHENNGSDYYWTPTYRGSFYR